ncbi:MAG: hypothetical protein IPN71_23720 [Fibrobacteres bacterium]|jgi:hypothetical protein|nr:hypothetical protein [Fibrobacterota bacterium]
MRVQLAIAMVGTIFLLIVPNASAASPRLSDPRTLRLEGLDPVLLHDHQRTSGEKDPLASEAATPLLGEQAHARVSGDSMIRWEGVTGAEWRSYQGLGRPAGDFGGLVEGKTEHLWFWLDARISVASLDSDRVSWDGQFQEYQQEGPDARADYTSFSRYEGMTWVRTPIGELGGGRSSEHWGPSWAYPLVLGREAAPASRIGLDLTWGSLRVRSTWASLAIDGGGAFRLEKQTRSLYAHRFDWVPVSWLTLGLTEAMILYDRQEPIAFLPMVPLFMEKGQGVEGDNNGELAADLEVRPLRGWRLYGEFLVDDFSEPTRLFNDLWKNRWAVTAGTQWAFQSKELGWGMIGEISRVEPWVYAHYVANTAQAAHQGTLLGSPAGPNSLGLLGLGYLTWRGLDATVSSRAIWKGTDLGSRWTDTLHDNDMTRKEWLAGGGSLDHVSSLALGAHWKRWQAWLDLAVRTHEADLQRTRPFAPLSLRIERRL